MIRTVLFDLDGVIRHFDPGQVEKIERAHGIARGTIESFAFASPLIEQVTTGTITRAEWLRLIGERLGNAEAAAAWGAQTFRVDTLVLDLAEELRASNVGAAILTNGTDTIPQEMAESGLLAHFDPIFNSASIGYVKPDRRAFEHVLSELRLAAHEVFFVDDSPAKLRGAELLGMPTHRFVGVTQLRAALREHGVGVGA